MTSVTYPCVTSRGDTTFMILKLLSITEVWCDGCNVPGHERQECFTHEIEFDVLDLPESHKMHNPYNVNMECAHLTARDSKWPEDASVAELLTLYINRLLLPHIERGMAPTTVESVTRDLRLDEVIHKNWAGTEFLETFNPKNDLAPL